MKSVTEINKAIASIKTMGAKFDKLVQTTGVDVLHHFAEHKDTGLVNRLYLAMPAGARKAALASWMLAYCAVVPNTDKDTKADKPFLYSKEKVTRPEAGEADPWFNHKPEKTPDQIFDLQVAVRAILKKAAKQPVAHGDVKALHALALAVGIPASDVPTQIKTVASVAEAMDAVGEASM